MTDNYRTEYSIETTASPEAIWQLFVDVPNWKRWNAGIDRIEMTEPFVAGSEFEMQPTGGPPLRSRLVDVAAQRHFIDETRLGELVITVSHRLEPIAKGTRITYAVEATGPGSDEVGPMVSGDFPDVLQALRAFAERP
ncbi:MAG TPA: SRPBCC family protein [Kofleriaceae bacterium]